LFCPFRPAGAPQLIGGTAATTVSLRHHGTSLESTPNRGIDAPDRRGDPFSHTEDVNDDLDARLPHQVRGHAERIVLTPRESRHSNQVRLSGRLQADGRFAVGVSRGVQLGEQRAAELVGGQDVETLVADERGGAGDRVQGPLNLEPDALPSGVPTRPRNRRLGSAGEVEEVGALTSRS
jgi:hypothetical protein